MKRILLIGLVSVLLSPFQAWAVSLNIDTVLYEDDGGLVDASLLSGTADLSVVDSEDGVRIVISLTNTTDAGAFGGGSSSRWLTGIGFDLPDTIDIIAGSTLLGLSSSLYNNAGDVIAGGGADVSGDWGYLNGISGHYNDFSTSTDTQISTMVADTGDNAFNDSLRKTYDGLATLDGPPMGLVSGTEILSGGYSIVDSLLIEILISGLDGFSAAELENFIQDGEVVLTFGSPDAGANPVPEPSTIVLLGSGLLGLACFRRRKN